MMQKCQRHHQQIRIIIPIMQRQINENDDFMRAILLVGSSKWTTTESKETIAIFIALHLAQRRNDLFSTAIIH